MVIVCSCPKDNCPMHYPNQVMGITTTTDNKEYLIIDMNEITLRDI